MTYNLIKLNNGRNCLRYIIRAFNIKEIYIPYYICPSIRSAVFKESCKINFYHVNQQFMPLTVFPKEAYILYPNYFGICSNIARELSIKYKNLIVDNAHSFFSEPLGIATFNSIRKFFPNIRNGAFLYSKKILDFNFLKDEYSYQYKILTNEDVIKNEYIIDSSDIFFLSSFSEKYFSMLNLENEKERIMEHFYSYSALFSSINEITINLEKNDVPYKYPLLITDKNVLQDVLIKLKNKKVQPLRFWQQLPSTYPESAFFNSLLVL